jgi:proteic killer suppression protein
MNLPGYRLHELKRAQAGIWSVTVSQNWRITFRFEGGSAHDVDFVDYH